MSGLFGALSRTTQALNAQSQGIYTAGRNMANVNNSDYARQRVALGDKGTVDTPLGPRSLGVEALGLNHVRDAILDKQVAREISLMAALEVEAEALFQAQLSVGQEINRQDDSAFVDSVDATGGGDSIGAAITELFNAFSSLAANPRSDAEKQILIQKAETLVSQFNTVDGRLDNLQVGLSERVLSEVDQVNGLLQSISDLNRQIAQFEITNAGGALDLRDKRQAKLEELAKFMDFVVEEPPGGAGQVRLFSKDAGENPVLILEKSEPFTAVSFDGSAFSAGGPPPVTLALSGGTMTGHLNARDGAIASLRGNLDLLAEQIVTAVNSAYNPGGSSTDFFLASGTTAASIDLDPTLTAKTLRATNTPDAGANEVALAVADLGVNRFDTAGGDVIDGTFASNYAGIVSGLANSVATAQQRYEDQDTIHRLILERRDSISGVSLDEEMAELVKYQRAFDASARVMRVIDEMLETVVNGLLR